MNILLTNDDGYMSPLTTELGRHLRLSQHNVFSFLPVENCSAASGSLTMNKTLQLFKKEGLTAVNGSPLDCLHISIQYLMQGDIPIDLVVSGINKGLNYGTANFYSGTVAAALEAQLYNISSMAINLEEEAPDEAQWWKIIRFVEEALCYICDHPLREKTLNINFLIKQNGGEKRACFENIRYDRHFILPSLEMAGINKGSAILKHKTSSNRQFAGEVMLGLLSRHEGFHHNHEEIVWLQHLCKQAGYKLVL